MSRALCERVKTVVSPLQSKSSSALRAGPGFAAKVTSISEYPSGPSSAERVTQSGSFPPPKFPDDTMTLQGASAFTVILPLRAR